ncbi:hypothetical protein [Streptomyces sp. SID3343]|uniref:hypothetical protein n=1 Tax=Streptomyces sp. SID3343 TaxID=2690260 RepID=UPI00136D5132|nr:hypothetical protein [Streptomyces sp. SID3343]MYW01525.1 hypothetical protein [Streptomyces sp. SID3343]
MRKRIVSVALAIAATATTAVMAAPPATANVGGLYLGINQNLQPLPAMFFTNSVANLGSSGQGDLASSAQNTDTSAWVLFDDRNYRDRRYCLPPGGYIANLHSGSWNFGDKTSSVLRLGTASCAGYPTF